MVGAKKHTTLFWRQAMVRRFRAVGSVPEILRHLRAALKYHKLLILLYDDQLSRLKADKFDEVRQIWIEAGYKEDEWTVLYSPEEILQHKRTLASYAFFYAWIGMLAHRQLDILDEIIPYLRYTGHNGSVFRDGLALAVVLPLPKRMDYLGIRNHPEELQEWFNQNRDKLIWSEEKDTFIIQDTE
ncbi:MAG: hypothetical protein Q9P01_08110 [Anaerolineae bacterium]|nr:hypothetical protein [Anaerolineae bacterium]MDQ7034789.1 hypothetical protein [Anaerolineae bacterium]